MGVITATLAIVAVCIGFRAAEIGCIQTAYAAAIFRQAIFALERAANVLSQPPGSRLYDGGPTAWRVAWELLTLRSLRTLFAPGSFGRAYALLVAPALAVAAVACVALAVRSGAVAAAARMARRSWRLLVGAAACATSLLLIDDALRGYLAMGRLFPAALRSSAATLVGFCGLVLLLGPAEDGGFSLDQALEWLRALGLMAAAANSGVGGITLLRRGLELNWYGKGGSSGRGVDASEAELAAAAPASMLHSATGVAANGLEEDIIARAADRVSFPLYGSLLLLAAAGFASCLTEGHPLLRLALAAMRLLRLRPLLQAPVVAVRWLWRSPAMRAAAAATLRADRLVSRALVGAVRGAAGATRELRAAVRRLLVGLVAWMRRLHAAVLSLPVWRSARVALRAVARTLGGAWRAAHRRLLLPLMLAARAAARIAYRTALGPAARAVVTVVRLAVAPLAWPAGAAVAALLFGQQAAVARSVLPFGGAAVAAAVIAGLMAGKSLRKSRFRALSRAGTSLERAAAAAYLHLDLGLGRRAARLIWISAIAAAVTVRLLRAAGQEVLALIAGPLAGLLTAVGCAAAWLWCRVARVVGPLAAAVAEALAVVWAQPELALAAAAAVLAAAYGAHRAAMPAVVWRLAGTWAAAAAGAAVRLLAWLLSPPLRLLVRAAAWLGLGPAGGGTSSAAAARAGATAASALARWGWGSGTGLGSLFRSGGFAGAFLGLNLLHAALLREWAVPALEAQGPVGRSAVLPVISFVARSMGKVALGPVYLTAAASLLVGRVGGRAAAAWLGSLPGPALCGMYLGALWLEGVRRVRLSYSPVRGSSEFGRMLSATRTASAADATRRTASAPAAPSPATAAAMAADSTRRTASAATFADAADATGSAAATAREAAEAARRQRVAYGLMYRRILAQGRPSHVFPTEECVVCSEELDLKPLEARSAAPSCGRTQGSSRGLGRHHDNGEAPVAVARSGEGVGEEGEASVAALVLRCGHVFHARCALRWLQRTPRCPVCREPAVGPARHANMLF